MNRYKKFLTALLLLALASFTSDSLPKVFSDLLSRAKMSFDRPEGPVETKFIPNKKLKYDYALAYPDNKFEVRYVVRPLDSLMRVYASKQENKQPGDISINPNDLCLKNLKAIISAISGQQAEIKEFPAEDVKNELNADWGATAFVEVSKEFGQSYKYCSIVAMHKENVGDAYCLYLYQSNDDVDKIIGPMFHALKFKQQPN